MEKIQNLTYLNCCVKETLRCDTVVPQSFDYYAKDDIQICKVPISKGTTIRIDLLASHFDDGKWLDEYEFIPERHDLESEYFAKLKQSGKKPEAYSRRTFSHGMRKCPGQTFAMLEMKVAIAYIVTHLDIQFDEGQLNNEDIGFGLGSHFVPLVSVQEH
uniref:Cytochrome P450 n=1 Tax=Euplotes crassus TaxID=5936 RepID=A0A7S3KV08_EUPCR|mmetsp:Transcript_9306/g.8973  ORF Transcript_9306/g.8973 Transcript_9306/m.8973 type:complete len:159 (+) Transcript_9306:1112-1588(+)